MNKYVVVSGGASGIGLEISKLCLEKNWTPVILGRNEEKLKNASKDLKDCPYLSIDLSKEDSKQKLKRYFENLNSGELLSVVNNAGVYKPLSILEADRENFIQQIEINLMSSLYTTQALYPHLKKSKASIVNISSTLGMRPIAQTGAYSASKAAMNSLTQTMALEFAEDGVRVNSICPGIVDTPIHKPSKDSMEDWKSAVDGLQPLGRVGQPKDIAETVVHLIEHSKWTTGTLINIDGGMLLKS
jgi:NAD(P)-dependent dehydrogenase (short-subunit alcohol dehydrogenase family)